MMENSNEKTKDGSLDLYIALSRASQWVNAHADRDIRKYGLNRTEFGVLELLYHKGAQPIQQIGGKVLMSSGNITYVVDKLEQKKLVQRKASTMDRRLIFAEITKEGTQFIEDVFPKHAEIIEQAVSGLSSEEKVVAAKLLKKLGKSAQGSFK
ncbi:MarR family winged helix-turn-helix transcriptional regulator [Paenibacillus eucommiae]|uniref:MarR family 2-MHQ and catechol resistance regulon transcriptional repressor n=1 Tax=Paenibacillus eucommiae TaxID=1355755 RepID=A0ABS4IXC9_9BACL|nr:MarR family transcriptional regulator [Paenibacillus eucommiae]MBP1991541.1 MarR family 2-MHQ and catechol resistance regulon transcriptional repressor [Paenibacillus eucommiae]